MFKLRIATWNTEWHGPGSLDAETLRVGLAVAELQVVVRHFRDKLPPD